MAAATAAEQKKTEKAEAKDATREYSVFVEILTDDEGEDVSSWELVEQKFTAKTDKEAIAAFVATLNEEQPTGRFFAISRFTIHTLKVEQKLAWT